MRGGTKIKNEKGKKDTIDYIYIFKTLLNLSFKTYNKTSLPQIPRRHHSCQNERRGEGSNTEKRETLGGLMREEVNSLCAASNHSVEVAKGPEERT